MLPDGLCITEPVSKAGGLLGCVLGCSPKRHPMTSFAVVNNTCQCCILHHEPLGPVGSTGAIKSGQQHARTPCWHGPVLVCILPHLHPALGCHCCDSHLPTLPVTHHSHLPLAGGRLCWGSLPSPLPYLYGAVAMAAGAAAVGPWRSPVLAMLH